MRSDDEMSLGEEFPKAKRGHEALAGSPLPSPHSGDLRQVWLVDCFDDQGTPCPGQEHGLDPFPVCSFVKLDRGDFSIGDNQQQYNFHWLEYLPENSVGL